MSQLIIVAKEGELPTITTLGDMAWNSWSDNSRKSSHALETACATVGCGESSMVSPELRCLFP